MKNNTLKRSKILALGSAFPDQIVTNKDLEKFVDTSDQWIRERSGIHERRKLRDGENNSDFAASAALNALKKAGLKPTDVDLIISCSNSPDKWLPAMACIVQNKIGAHNNCGAFDLLAACAGWVVGLQVADQFIKAGTHKAILVIGSEAMTRFLNWNDRATCVLFGDGAGACVVVPAEEKDKSEILTVKMHSDGRYGDILDMPGTGSTMPTSKEVLENNLCYFRMNGGEVFKHAVRNMASIAEEILEENNVKVEDIDWFIPHQANIRIIEAVAKKLSFPTEKIALNVHKYGNTSAATIPSAFDEYVDTKKIKRGDLVLMSTFGGGLTWAGALIRW